MPSSSRGAADIDFDCRGWIGAGVDCELAGGLSGRLFSEVASNYGGRWRWC